MSTKTSSKRRAPLPADPAQLTGPAHSLDQRARLLNQRLANTSDQVRANYLRMLDMSWIYHDAVLDGVVYTSQEIDAALDARAYDRLLASTEASLHGTIEDIRLHKKLLDRVRQLAGTSEPVSVEMIREFSLILHPEEGDLKSVKYRKDIPQHRLYFHEYCQPDKIAARVRAVVDWINDPEVIASRSAIRLAARAHYDLLRVFPFSHDSGKISRMLMNLLLLRAGHAPAIVDARERQRYYEALKGSPVTMNQIVTDSITNGLNSVERLLENTERA